MSESEGKSYEYMHGYVMGLRWARKTLKPEIIEDWHGKSNREYPSDNR